LDASLFLPPFRTRGHAGPVPRAMMRESLGAVCAVTHDAIVRTSKPLSATAMRQHSGKPLSTQSKPLNFFASDHRPEFGDAVAGRAATDFPTSARSRRLLRALIVSMTLSCDSAQTLPWFGKTISMLVLGAPFHASTLKRGPRQISHRGRRPK
jgi:hypothetical protein